MRQYSPVCPYCDGPIADHTEGFPGEMMTYYRCAGACQRLFYPPWSEHCWEDPDTRPIPPELTSRYPVVIAHEHNPTAPPRQIRRLVEYVQRCSVRLLTGMIGIGSLVAIAYVVAHRGAGSF